MTTRAPSGLLAAVLGIGSVAVLATLAVIDPAGSTWALLWVSYAVMGLWVIWRRPSNRIGWLLMAVAAIFTSVTVINWFVASGWGPRPVGLEMLANVLGSLGWLTFLLMVLLFPDGLATSRSQAWLIRLGGFLMIVSALAVVTSGAPLSTTGRRPPLAATPAAAVSHAVAPVGQVLLALFPLAVLFSLIARWRASRDVERQQLKWLLWGAAVTIATVAAGSSASRSVGPSVLGYALWIIGGAALPASIAVAVTRYRLYDIDRVISRTAAYALVTVSLVAIFAALVASSSSLLGPDNQLGVATATLVAAAIARPVYRKVQLVVDRRFDRARYDGRVTVEDFGLRLSHEVDTLTVADDLERTIQSTLAPTTVGLWLRGNS